MTNTQLYLLLAAPALVAIIQGALLIKYIDAKIDGKIDGVNARIDGIQKQIDQILSRLTGIESALRGLYETAGRHDEAIEGLKRERK